MRPVIALILLSSMTTTVGYERGRCPTVKPGQVCVLQFGDDANAFRQAYDAADVIIIPAGNYQFRRN